jgi:4-amino-4-deoxy-L-arabinose transferase-like glycosyltransferase
MPLAPHERLRALIAAVSGVLVVLPFGALADRFARHGWTASWYVEHAGARIEIARSTEHRIVFPNEQRALARYVQHWDFVRLGVPDRLPVLDATLRARLRVPPGGRRLTVASSERTAIRVDGRSLREGELVGEGWHRLEIDWQGTFHAGTRFELLWGTSPGTMEPVPREALVPLEGSWPPLRIALWVGALIAAAWLSWQLVRIATAPLSHRGAQIAALATALLVALALGFRLFDYDVMPDYRENDDERFAIWNGYSLLQDGTTRGITLWWGEYLIAGVGRIERVPYFERTYHLVTPYFEHPPLLHLLVGAAGHLGGAREFREVRLMHARLVPIALSALTLVLLVAIGRRLFPRGPAPWLGGLLWSTIPWIAIQTRVIKEEALLTPLALGAFWCFLRWRDEGRRRSYLVSAALLSGLCPLAKVTGAAFLLALWILIAAEKRPRDLAIAIGIGLLMASMLFVYGAAIDWGTFVFAQRLQTSRPVHFNLFPRFFDDPLINHNLVGRGWLLFLWIAALGGMFRRSRRDAAVIGVPLVVYLAAIALGSGTWTFGWYITPVLPYLCLAAGCFLADLWKQPDLVRGALLTFLLVFYTLNFTIEPSYARNSASWAELRRLVSFVLFAFLAPFALAHASAWAKPLGRAAMVAGLTTLVVVGAIFVVRYDVYATTYRNFDRDAYFDR